MHVFLQEHRISVVIPEEKEQGTISTRTYYQYFRAGGTPVLVMGVFLCLLLGDVSNKYS